MWWSGVIALLMGLSVNAQARSYLPCEDAYAKMSDQFAQLILTHLQNEEELSVYILAHLPPGDDDSGRRYFERRFARSSVVVEEAEPMVCGQMLFKVRGKASSLVQVLRNCSVELGVLNDNRAKLTEYALKSCTP